MTLDTRILSGQDYVSIDTAALLIKEGGLVGMPTETVYGLAANALDTAAVAKVFEAKGRPSFDPLIVHVPDLNKASQLGVFSDIARSLAEEFWPGSMTLVVPRKIDESGSPIVPDLVTSGLDSVGLRVPNHPVTRDLFDLLDVPFAAPSANRFGAISPTTAKHVIEELGGRIHAVLDGGPCRSGLESTVVRVLNESVDVLRLGALPVEEIERVVGGPVQILSPTSTPGQAAKPSPGMTERHYAPSTPMVLAHSIRDLESIAHSERFGLIGVGELPVGLPGFDVVRNLSEAGDLVVAASKLFQTLRELDVMGLDGIAALAVPDEGLGRAINDRLKRGSAR